MFMVMFMMMAVVVTMLMVVIFFLAEDLDLHVSALYSALDAFLGLHLNPRYPGTVYFIEKFCTFILVKELVQCPHKHVTCYSHLTFYI